MNINLSDNKMQCEYCKQFRPISEFEETSDLACKECRNNPYHVIDSGQIELGELESDDLNITTYGRKTLGYDFFTDGGGI